MIDYLTFFTNGNILARQLNLKSPALLIDEDKARANIRNMAEKARKSSVLLRPHFKTHQSAEIGEWFRNEGIDHCTVSSIEMAEYFAANGWKHITVAFPVNLRQAELINELASQVELDLLVENLSAALNLAHEVKEHVNIWIKIDCGYGRTGVDYKNSEKVIEIALAVSEVDNFRFKGLLSHAGNSYNAVSTEECGTVFQENVNRINTLKKELLKSGIESVAISVGDTPGCSVVDKFENVDEIRPGNFVFYDLQQEALGVCKPDDIAVVLACPVVTIHADRNEIVVHGGAVHFSKDKFDADGNSVFGLAAIIEKGKWTGLMDEIVLKKLSQEHGIISASKECIEACDIGDVIYIYPAHSCLTANLLKKYMTLKGSTITMFNP